MRLTLATTLAFVLWSAAPAAAQGEFLSEDELRERHRQKMSKAWLELAPWFTDYEEALREARRTGKPVLAYFTRSFQP